MLLNKAKEYYWSNGWSGYVALAWMTEMHGKRFPQEIGYKICVYRGKKHGQLACFPWKIKIQK